MKQRQVLKKLGEALVSEHLKVLTYESFTFQKVTQLTRDIRKKIKESVVKPLKEPTAKVSMLIKVAEHVRQIKIVKRHISHSYHKYVCREHTIPFCSDSTYNNDPHCLKIYIFKRYYYIDQNAINHFKVR